MEDSTHFIGMIIFAVILIIMSMIFSASESAFLSINKLRLRLLRNKGNKRAIRAARLLENKERLINSILFGNNLVNIALSAIVTSICLKLFGRAGLGWATLVVTITLLIFGEIIPKTIATRYSEKIAFASAPFISLIEIIFTPFVFILTKIVRLIAKTFHIKMEEKKISFTEEEIKQFIQVSEEEGVLESGEKIMMNRVFKFSDLSAHDIMTPRTKIRAIPANISYKRLIELYEKTNISRFPVYGKDLDDIKGILYMKDLLFSVTKESDFKLESIIHSPLFILENKKMSSIQQMLDENHESMAIVVDEYSGTAGILTKKDIAEEIFGNIADEIESVNLTDNQDIQKIDENTCILSGTTRISELNDLLSVNIKSENYETLNGFLTEYYDGFPDVNTVISVDGIQFKILDATQRKINRVEAKK